MNSYLPLFLIVFLGIFHILGGGAVGRGLRVLKGGSVQALSLIVWGLFMGGLPLLFTWTFLIEPGQLAYGLIGPFLFVVAALAGAYLELDLDRGAVFSAALGTAAFLLGLLSIPLLLDALKTSDSGMTDYFFGGVFVLAFVVVGGSFAWNGFSAMLRGISVNELFAERERKMKNSRKDK